MMLQAGDRVRLVEQGEAGLPSVRYGWISRIAVSGAALVLFDDALDDAVVEQARLEPVSVTELRLELDGTDLLAEPALRSGLAALWAAEAEQAGLDVAGLRPLQQGRDSDSHSYA